MRAVEHLVQIAVEALFHDLQPRSRKLAALKMLTQQPQVALRLGGPILHERQGKLRLQRLVIDCSGCEQPVE